MDRQKIELATTFFADASEYKKNKNVRGYFGRGLKETIIALGIGEIITIKDNKLNRIKIWFDKDKKKVFRDFIVEDEKVNETIREEYGIKKDGTFVKVSITNEEIKIPELETLRTQLKNHICLRDILSSKKRKVLLQFCDMKRSSKHQEEISFESLKGEEVLNKPLKVPGFNNSAILRVYETKETLPQYKKYSPFNLTGILIKTPGAILDNQLFKFENDPASYYFYGELISEEIDKILRSGETSILNPSRSGIEWGHRYAQILMKSIERELEPLIEEKKKELAKNKHIEVNENSKKLLKELSKLFNQIYEEELEEGDIDINVEDIFEEDAFIRPKSPNLPPRKPRTLCLYANENIIKSEGEQAIITSQKNKIYIIDPKIYLEKHPKYSSMFWAKFKVEGLNLGDEDIIEARIGKSLVFCDVRVKEMGHIGKNPQPQKKGGITGFNPNSDPNPMQRAYHNQKTGKIEIFIQFPGVARYLGESLENVETETGKMLLCEIVCEAFFKRIAEERIKKGKETPFGDSIIVHMALYRNTVDNLQKKYMNKVYSLVMNWDFNEEENQNKINSGG
ncbi:hypothetical protein J4463_01730 [Candidatus Pacearchaeota archaeon]|nr:hypothetical protein [Candidatus Pacearchaeota archaeon]